MELDDIIDGIYKMPEFSRGLLKSNLAEVSFPKGYLLISANKIENTIYLIKKGIVRAYSDTENSQITFWFGKEGDTVISMKSYVANQKGYDNIELLEDCELFAIDKTAIEELYSTDINIANWGRKFAEKELLSVEERFISRQFKSATERYTELMQNTPYLLQRVSLGHIASYLGIIPASLSRIRAEIK